MSGRKIALMDFDGTITKSDSLKEFIIHTQGKVAYYTGLLRLAPFLILYKTGLLANWKAKERLLQYFFSGIHLQDFDKYCSHFSRDKLPAIIRTEALRHIISYKEDGVRVVVVSASPENWIGLWAQQNNLEWIATRLETKEERLTGKILGKNCHGKEKVRRICERIDLNQFSEIYTFGDSHGDLPMLHLGTEKHYKPFR